MSSVAALLIPVEGPMEDVQIIADSDGSMLACIQALVGGNFQPLNLPTFIEGCERATAMINEDGKALRLPPNMRATDFLVPGSGLMWGDYIAGPMVLAGFDASTGETTDIPAGVYERARLIEREAA